MSDGSPRISENFGNLTMLAATLQSLVNSGSLTARQAAEATGMDLGTFYRWLSGADPGAAALRQLFRGSSHTTQAALLAWLVGDSGWVSTHLSPDLDINGDGAVNTDDALEAAAKANEQIAAALRVLVAQDAMDKIGDGTRTHLEQLGHHAMQGIAAALRIVAEAHDRQVKRRKARPSPKTEVA